MGVDSDMSKRKIYSGPKWAWDTIWETISADIQSKSFDAALRTEIKKAYDAINEGKDAADAVCTIIWSIADVQEALTKAGYEPTDDNVQKVIANRLDRTLKDRSIEEGWEILDVIVTSTDGLNQPVTEQAPNPANEIVYAIYNFASRDKPIKVELTEHGTFKTEEEADKYIRRNKVRGWAEEVIKPIKRDDK